MSEAALAPTMGPITEEERRLILAWHDTGSKDIQCRDSIIDEDTLWESEIRGAYVLVRALRAGAKLEDLL